MQPNNRPTRPGAGPVMDIQRQRPSVQQPFRGNGMSRPATMEYTRPRSNYDTSSPGVPTMPTEVSQPAADPSLLQTQPVANNRPKRSKKPLVITLIVVLLLAAGAAGAYYFFMLNDDVAGPPPVSTPATVEEEPAVIDATPEGVDRVVEIIDESLDSIDDDADFSPNDISNDSLGL